MASTYQEHIEYLLDIKSNSSPVLLLSGIDDIILLLEKNDIDSLCRISVNGYLDNWYVNSLALVIISKIKYNGFFNSFEIQKLLKFEYVMSVDQRKLFLDEMSKDSKSYNFIKGLIRKDKLNKFKSSLSVVNL